MTETVNRDGDEEWHIQDASVSSSVNTSTVTNTA
jgi:hypothetical protein